MPRRFQREAKTLRDKALASLRRALEAFNSFNDDGRQTAVLLHLQHACEMLLKGALLQKHVRVFDKEKGTSYGFKKCVNLACQHCGLDEDDAGTMRAVDSLRDAEQHWFVMIEEDNLYLHTRAVVTSFDDLQQAVFRETLAEHFPSRVLPLSTLPPVGFDLLVDREYRQIGRLLRPGKRKRDEVRGRIRTLLAMEAHVTEEVDVSEKDIDRIETAIKRGEPWSEIFPRLAVLDTRVSGEGVELRVKFNKKEGTPVRFIAADDPEEAAAVREVPLHNRYRYSPQKLAELVGLTTPKSKVLREHLKIDEDKNCMYLFQFGSQEIPRFSDRAVELMREGLEEVDMDELWEEKRPRGRRRA